MGAPVPNKIDVPPKHWDGAFAPSSCLVIITTMDDQGRVNAASFGTCTRVCHDPVHISFTCAVGKDTTNNILANGQFVANIVPFEQDVLDKVLLCGLPFRPGVDELERAGLTALAGEGRATVWVHAVAADGAALTPPPPVPPTWILVDGAVGGSGETYDWGGVAAPTGATRGWLLAGGLTPDTVAAAVAALGPTGVDVSSGVCGADGIAKDEAKIEAFVKAAKL